MPPLLSKSPSGPESSHRAPGTASTLQLGWIKSAVGSQHTCESRSHALTERWTVATADPVACMESPAKEKG
jgi:hypothetical protein